jgi:opacity protein-like surface antigen
MAWQPKPQWRELRGPADGAKAYGTSQVPAQTVKGKRTMSRAFRCAVLALAALAAAAVPRAGHAVSTPATSGQLVTSLIGRWAGDGQAQFKDGKHEPFKCVVVYFTDKAGDKVRQTIRCNSARLDLNLENDWSVADGSISGTWHETHYELKGTLLGSLDPEGYNLYAENEFGNATISVRTSQCQQDVVMMFSREVDLLTAQLKKC